MKDRARSGYIVGIVSVITNTLLFGLKLWAGIVTGSIAITADAWHTLSDSISSLIVIASVKLSSKKADREHPFGHGRWEQIAAIVIAFLLAVIAFDFMKQSITRLSDRELTVFGPLAITVIAISVVGKEAMAQYAFWVARRTDNVTVRADGWHHRTDALSSLIVLLGILFAREFWWMDSVLGMIVSLLLFYATYEIVKEAIMKLLGEQPAPDLINGIETEIKKMYKSDCRPHHYHIHNYVSHRELTFHIQVGEDLSVARGHEIASAIEKRIQDEFGVTATIHVEPLGSKD